MDKSIFDSLAEYKFKTISTYIGKNSNMQFKKVDKENICSVYRPNAVISCPSWNDLEGTYNYLFAEDNQLDLFNNKKRMGNAVFKVVDKKNLTFHLTFAQIQTHSLDEIISNLARYKLQFAYKNHMGTIQTQVMEDCPYSLGGLISENVFEKPAFFEPFDNTIFNIFKHFKLLTGNEDIASTGVCRFFHNKEFTALQLNYVQNDKQKEIITAISMNDTLEARQREIEIEKADVDSDTGEVSGQTKLKVEKEIKKNKQKVTKRK